MPAAPVIANDFRKSRISAQPERHGVGPSAPPAAVRRNPRDPPIRFGIRQAVDEALLHFITLFGRPGCQERFSRSSGARAMSASFPQRDRSGIESTTTSICMKSRACIGHVAEPDDSAMVSAT